MLSPHYRLNMSQHKNPVAASAGATDDGVVDNPGNQYSVVDNPCNQNGVVDNPGNRYGVVDNPGNQYGETRLEIIMKMNIIINIK